MDSDHGIRRVRISLKHVITRRKALPRLIIEGLLSAMETAKAVMRAAEKERIVCLLVLGLYYLGGLGSKHIFFFEPR